MSELLKNVASFKLEATPGVRETDMSTAQAVYSEDEVLVAKPDLKNRTFIPLSAFKGGERTNIFKAWGKLPFKITRPLPIDVAVFDGSDMDILLQISGHSRTPIYQTPGDDQTPIVGYKYAPDTNSAATASVDIVGEKRKFTAHGAKAALSISFAVGKVAMLTFDVSSAYDDMTEGAFVPPFVTPPEAAMIDDRNEYGKVELDLQRFDADDITFDTGADVKPKETFKGMIFRMVDYKPTVGIKGFLDDVNTLSIDAAVAGSEMAFRVTIKDPTDLTDPQDPTTGKVKWLIYADKIALKDVPGPSDKDGLYYLDKVFKMIQTAGDDNYAIEYYL